MTRGKYLTSLLPIRKNPRKKRRRKLDEFMVMEVRFKAWCLRRGFPIRNGEAHRPKFVAERYSRMGLGILKTKHRWSMADDIWLDPTGYKPLYFKRTDPMTKYHIMYWEMGLYWEKMGGQWGGRFRKYDIYHFAHPERP